MRTATTEHLQALRDLGIARTANDSDAHIDAGRRGGDRIVHSKQRHGFSEAIGSWKMDETGRRCADVTLPAFNMNTQQCGYTGEFIGTRRHVRPLEKISN